MARFLLVTMPVPGHVAPLAPVARALVERGHEVVWYGSSVFKSKIEATGARFAPIKRALDYGDSDYDKHFPGRAKVKDLAQIKFDFKHLFADQVEGQLADLREIDRELDADVIVCDPAMAAVKIMSDQGGPPYAVLNISVLGVPSRDVPPFGLGMLPSYTTLGRIRNKALYWIAEKVVFRDVQKHFDAITDRIGFPRTPFRPLVSPYLQLQPSVQGFEYPRSDMPPQVHFIGALLPEGSREFTPPSWWDRIVSASRPVVLVTQGTIATDAEQLIAPSLAALEGEDLTVVVTTGGKSAAELGLKVPANAYVEPFIPFGELMPHVSIMITNGGYGGVMIALAYGVPLIAGGTTEDKPEVTNRVAYSGVGINLKTATPTPEQIKEGVRKIIADDGYRKRARTLQAELASHNAPLEAAQLLERLAATKKPVGG